jgi:T5SS/PEP-CTERM-associated repeat protein
MMSHLRRLLAIATGVSLSVVLPKVALSAVSFSGDTTISSTITIGGTSFGTFRIDGGSVYTSPASTVTIGQQSSGIGFATVTDPGSQWNWASSANLTVGNSGFGRLDILNGAVLSTGFSGGINIASSPSSQGIVNVQGSGSLLNATNVNVGGFTTGGSALLQIGAGATVNATSGGSSITTGGRLELTGGMFRTNGFTQNGVIIGSGEVFNQSTSSITNGGRIESSPGGLLRLTNASASGAITNQGNIAAENGEIEFQRAVTNATSGPTAGEVTLLNGRLRAGTLVTSPSSPQLTNSANLASTGGESDLYGRVTNTATGRIAVTNNSVLRFHDDVVADGGVVTVFPGSKAIFLEDLTMNAGSTLQANLAGTTPTTNYGIAEVVGTATIADVGASLAQGYTPQLGDSFTLLKASSLGPLPELGTMPELPSGLMWDLGAVSNQLVLSVVAVPEPSMAALVFTGFALLFGRRQRNR